MAEYTERPADFSAGDAVAVIGLGCRLAGDINSPDEFWEFLMAGKDAVSERPADRWREYAELGGANAAAIRRATRYGAFLSDIAGFDAEFFGITPREAELMDPQQRILLEVCWEALEHAGIIPAEIAGTDTGVFVGVGSDDYGRRLLEDLPRIEAWTGIGAAMCAVANRISYTLDLRGPSVAVDTACSSSLVAIHQACQSLRLGEVPLALVGGVMIMAGPGLTMVLDAAGATSADGRCKSFDASADGYGRGEGAGIAVLKLLRDAERDGDRVLAVIRGSGVHQDGRTNGIMAPSRSAQEHLFRRVYAAAGVSPSSVGYVEAHGTGTRMGDPIEVSAMSAVFGAGRPAGEPCLIGSVKPNIGHLEAGAGIAGMIKAVLALHRGQIPPTANFSRPTPEVDWARSGLRVVDRPISWRQTEQPRRAAVSGYGYGGTIAHLILEEAPEPSDSAVPPVRPADQPGLFPLSGNTTAALRQSATRLADWLEGDAVRNLNCVGYTLARRRSQLPERATVVADDRPGLIAKLRALAAGESAPGLSAGRAANAAATSGQPVWVFSGHGSHWAGMGRELLLSDDVFAAALAELEPAFRTEIGFSLRDTLLDGRLTDVAQIQPLIYAVQVGLSAVWRAHGVRPAAVIGHSVGEIAAAVAAGMLSPVDGARLVCRRSRLLRRVMGKGAMRMVNLPFDTVAERLAGLDGVSAAIAASPQSTVIAGAIGPVEQVAAEWAQQGLVVRTVDSDVAFHTRYMEPLLDELSLAAADLTVRGGTVPVYATALADPRANPPRDGKYWAANLRNPVRFADAVLAAAADGYRCFLEIAAHPVVSQSIEETLAAVRVEDAFVGHSLRRGKPERETLLDNLGALYCHGGPLDWSACWPAGALADIPPMSWQHRHFWAASTSGRSMGGGHDADSHTLLGTHLTISGTTPLQLWQTFLDHTCRPYPGEHPVREVEIVPAAVLLNTFFAAAAGPAGDARPGRVLTEVALRVPVSVSTPRQVQLTVQDRMVRLTSRQVESHSADDEGWLTHTTAVLGGEVSAPPRSLELVEIIRRCPRSLPENFVIDRLASVGVAAMGFHWRVEQLRIGEREMLVRVEAPTGTTGSWAPVLDAALSAASVIFPGEPTLRMPAAIKRVVTYAPPPPVAVIHVRMAAGANATDTVDVDIADDAGNVLASMTGLRYGLLEGDTGAVASPLRLVHRLRWRPAGSAPSEPIPDEVVLVGPDTPWRTELATYFSGHGLRCSAVTHPDELEAGGRELPSGAVVVVPPVPAGQTAVDEAAAQAAWLLTRTAQLISGSSRAGRGPRLWCLTRGVHEATGVESLAHSPLWGIARVVASEQPGLWGALIDLDDDCLRAGNRSLLEAFGRRGEAVLVVRPDAVLVGRLAQLDQEPRTQIQTFRPDASYLITGGLGALGLEIGRWMISRGARRLVLAGRRVPSAADLWSADSADASEQIRAVRALEELGATVRLLELDITDRAAAARLLSPAQLQLPPIRGVVHAAGVLDSRMLGDVDEASLRTVMAPKVQGAWVLHECFPVGSVDFFTLFSSCGPLLGLTGQTSYAAGNEFLNALAAHRRASGDTGTVSFGWTSWRGLGMSTSSAVIDAELAARGTGDITMVEAFRCWEHAERYDGAYFPVLRVIPPEPGGYRIPVLEDLEVPAADESERADQRSEWELLEDAELRAYLVGRVAHFVGEVMKLAETQIDIGKPLTELGLDSVMTVAVRRRLEKQFRLQLPATLLWEYPSVAAIADYLRSQLRADQPDPAEVMPSVAVEAAEQPAEVLVG
jgi:6-methylsalicylic acid synthase